jgi:hypothetical protein
VETFQAQGVAAERVRGYQSELDGLDVQLESGPPRNAYEIYSRLDEILDDLKRQKSKATEADRKAAEELISRAKALQKSVRSTADASEPEAARRKKASKTGGPQGRNENGRTAGASAATPRTVAGILSEAGWVIEGDVALLAAVVQESLEAVMGGGSSAYLAVINQIGVRLTGDANDI